MKRFNILLKLCAVGLLLNGVSCDLFPVDPQETYTQQYKFAAQFLDAFFIFREDLPSDLYSFPFPQALYQYVNEPYTAFYTVEIARLIFGSLNTSSQGGGIGMWIDSVYNGYVIKDVFPNSPAQRAGLLRRDTITAVDGKSAAGLNWRDSLSLMLSGNIGDSLSLDIRRSDTSLMIYVELGTYNSPTVFVDTLDSTIAYIKLFKFLAETNTPGGSSQEFRDALFATSWAGYTIIDLQGNPGGRIDQCVEITSELVPDGTPIIETSERDLDENYRGYTHDSTYYSSMGGYAASRNLILLADGKSASASEILISCIKYNRPEVLILGDTTYGKARMQVLGQGPDSSLAIVTCGVLNPPGNESYDLEGIAPDVVIEADQDAQDVAVNTIKGSATAKRSIFVKNSVRLLGTEKKYWIPLAIK